MLDKQAYDYIIAGMGCAGLSLAVRLSLSDLPFKKVLLVDKEVKNNNDRTWCFWTKEEENWYQDIIFRSWNKFDFYGPQKHIHCDISPYRYQMIRGIDFYKYCLDIIENDQRFEILTANVTGIEQKEGIAKLTTTTATHHSKILFNSIFRKNEIKEKEINYVQHFKGWVVESDTPVFKEDCPVFMDFRVPQQNDCRFVYILPFSPNRALVEYTGFSPQPISEDAYNNSLKHYLEKIPGLKNYHILEEEKGIIPMYESSFVNDFGSGIVNIGIAAGSAKMSTGFTFYFIQQHVSQIIQALKTNKSLHYKRNSKHRYYDKVLLDVMNKKQIAPADIFEQLFLNNKPQKLLSFLNEESTLKDDILIMNSVPRLHFLHSAVRKIF